VAAAVTAGFANWLRLRAVDRQGVSGPVVAASAPARSAAAGPHTLSPVVGVALPDLGPGDEADDGHTIYLDRWAGRTDRDRDETSAPVSRGPSSLP
jgi:hypothetical protein